MAVSRIQKRKEEANKKAKAAALDGIPDPTINWDETYDLIKETNDRIVTHVTIVGDVVNKLKETDTAKDLKTKLDGILTVLQEFERDIKDVEMIVVSAHKTFLDADVEDKFNCVMDFQEASIKLGTLAQESLKVILDFNTTISNAIPTEGK